MPDMQDEHSKISRLVIATGLSSVQVKKLLRERSKPHNKLILAAWDKTVREMRNEERKVAK